MAFRNETKHSMLRRCADWDYRQPCIYMITLVLSDRRSQALGRLAIPDGPAREQDRAADATVALSPAGEAVKRAFLRIGEYHPEVKPLFIQVMPDHVHFIIHVTHAMAKPLGHVVGGFKTGSSKAAVGRPGLWAEGFQDTILFHEGQLAAMFNYLRDNPRRLAVKRLCPDYFRLVRDLKVELGLPPQAHDRAAGTVPGVAGHGLTAHFSAIGNVFLLDSPTIIQVQCSRADFTYERRPKPGGGRKIARDRDGCPVPGAATPGFEAKRDMLLAAAAHGAILLSPCISDGEREIARLAFDGGAAVIALRNMGFSPLHKPGGRLFDKTADGKLLLLAPIAWPYSTEEKPMTRLNACVLNRLAQLLARDGAAEINYRGMKPANIDRLVREAVTPKGGSV